MKKFGLLLVLAMISIPMYSQDIVYKKDGKTIEAKVSEITDEEISYKMFSNPDGPVFKLATDKIVKIVFENGEEYAFVEEKANHGLSSDASLEELIAPKNNVYIKFDDQSGTFDEKDEFIRDYIKDYTYWAVVETLNEADFVLFITAYSKKTWRTAPADTYFMTASICRPDETVLWTGDEEWGSANIYAGMNPVRDVSKKVIKSLAKELNLPKK